MKVCSRCHKEKAFSEFHPDKRKTSGLASDCKACHRTIGKTTADRHRANINKIIPITKRCPRCEITKLSSSFGRSSCRYDGLESACKECRQKKYQSIVLDATHPVLGLDLSSPRRRRCVAAYGMTLEEFNGRLKAQNYACAICRHPETKRRNGKLLNLNVDHNHATNINRDLLCSRCNLLIGRANENPQLLESAANYLKRHSNGGNQGDSGTHNCSDSPRTSSISG